MFFSGSPRELRRRKKKRFHQPSPGLHFPVISACCLAAFSRSSIVSSLQMMTMALRISSWPSREVMVREQKEKRGEMKSESFFVRGEFFFFFFSLSLQGRGRGRGGGRRQKKGGKRPNKPAPPLDQGHGGGPRGPGPPVDVAEEGVIKEGADSARARPRRKRDFRVIGPEPGLCQPLAPWAAAVTRGAPRDRQALGAELHCDSRPVDERQPCAADFWQFGGVPLREVLAALGPGEEESGQKSSFVFFHLTRACAHTHTH